MFFIIFPMLLVPFTINAVKQEALLAIFKLIDADCGGSISKLELIGAVYRVLVWEIPWGGGSQVAQSMATHGVESLGGGFQYFLF